MAKNGDELVPGFPQLRMSSFDLPNYTLALDNYNALIHSNEDPERALLIVCNLKQLESEISLIVNNNEHIDPDRLVQLLTLNDRIQQLKLDPKLHALVDDSIEAFYRNNPDDLDGSPSHSSSSSSFRDSGEYDDFFSLPHSPSFHSLHPGLSVPAPPPPSSSSSPGPLSHSPSSSSSSASSSSVSGLVAPIETKRVGHHDLIDPASLLPSGKVNCPICFLEIELDDSFTFESCHHTYCQECLGFYFKQNIVKADINIKCPDPSCSTLASPQEIQAVVPAPLFEKFNRFSMIAAFKDDDTVRWCPKDGCPGMTIGEPDEGELIVTCHVCYTRICYKCQVPWHEGAPCAVIQSNALNDPKTQKWKKKHGVKACPHCGLETIRISGCPSMVCSGCKQHWDWNYDGDPYQEETKVEQIAFMFPRLLKEVLGSKEMEEEFETNKKEAIKHAAIATGIISAIGIPIFIATAPPALVVRSGRKIKRSFSSLSNWLRKEKPEEPEDDGL